MKWLIGTGILVVAIATTGTLFPAEWYPVRLSGINCTMRKIKDPTLMPKLREQDAAVKVEAERQAKIRGG